VVSAGAVRWLVQGAAGAALLTQIRQACDLGMGLFACPAALSEQGLATEQLIPEVEGVRGAASLIGAAVAPNARVLHF
jgi:predicted peroxiredoxin